MATNKTRTGTKEHLLELLDQAERALIVTRCWVDITDPTGEKDIKRIDAIQRSIGDEFRRRGRKGITITLR